MNWRSHAIIGAVFTGLVFWVLGTRDIFSLAFVVIFGALSALVPDLDHDSSKGRQWLDLAFVAFAGLSAYGSGCGTDMCLPGIQVLANMIITFLAMVGVYFLFFRFFKPRHRGITHTIAVCFGFGVLLYLLAGFSLALAGFIGYLSHLIADQHVRML